MKLLYSRSLFSFSFLFSFSTFVVCIVGLAGMAYAQSDGTLVGTVRNDAGETVSGIKLTLSGTTLGAITGKNGSFRIPNVLQGAYTLIASGIGLKTQRRQVNLDAGQTLTQDFVFGAASVELQNIEITGRRESTYRNTTTFVTKSGTLLKDVPQSISYVTKELIADRQALRVGEIVKNMSGVGQFSFYNDFTMRGFRSSVDLVNGLRFGNGDFGFWKQPLTINLERVEVIKGPASALFGNANAGGTLNRVTKKPLDETRQSVMFSTGSFNTYRAAADFTGPVNEEKTLLYRMNIGYENAGSFRNLQFSRNYSVAPSFSFIPNDQTQVNFDLFYNRSESRLDRGQPTFGTPQNVNLEATPTALSLSRPNDYLNEDNLFITASLTHRFTSDIAVNVSYIKVLYSEDLLEHRNANRFAVDSAGRTIPTLVENRVFLRKRNFYNDNLSAFVTANIETGPVRHRFLVGYDVIQQELPLGGALFEAAGYRNAANTGTIASYVPAQKSRYLLDAAGRPVPNVPHFDLTAVNPYTFGDASRYFFAAGTNAVSPTLYYAHGVYAQDQVTFGNLQVLLGVRQDWYFDRLNYLTPQEDIVQQMAFLPRFGAVYSATDDINFYASYMQGFQPQSAGVLRNPLAGGPFDPLKSWMVEAGAKAEFFEKRFAVNIAAYQIVQNNVLVNANDPVNPQRLEQRGEERSRGIELDALGRILPNLSIIANYALNEAIITQSSNPALVGRVKENAPVHQGGFWVKYMADGGLLGGTFQGLGIGIGGNVVTERFVSDFTFKIPAYTLFDAAVYYTVGKFQIALNLYNLADAKHWVGGYSLVAIFPGNPRNFLATVAYTF
jgi:iron complex outermembrane recepter protein